MGHSQFDDASRERAAWNAGKHVGTKRPLTQKQIWAIRFFLDRERRIRDRALFDLAIDSIRAGADGRFDAQAMLPACRSWGGKLPDRFWAPKPGKRPFRRLLYFDRDAPPNSGRSDISGPFLKSDIAVARPKRASWTLPFWICSSAGYI